MLVTLLVTDTGVYFGGLKPVGLCNGQNPAVLIGIGLGLTKSQNVDRLEVSSFYTLLTIHKVLL